MITASDARVRVIHRDDEMLVLDKPSGLSVLADRQGPCLWDRLRDEGLDPLVVHRIDKGTSGLLIVALTRAAQRNLSALFEARRIRKWYLARLAAPLEHRGTVVIDLPITQGRKNRQRIAGPRENIVSDAGFAQPPRTAPAADPAQDASSATAVARYALSDGARFADRPGRDALTRVRVISRDDPTLIVAAPVTGRTHQIRVHLGWIGHPLLGDALYGDRAGSTQAARLALHCHRLVLPMPAGGSRSFTAPVPEDFPAARAIAFIASPAEAN